ncbi:unnamed protein product [Rotaria magnacalcarata]|uniref:ABC transmembrane type-1 domain-containing protein n=1 Tax=Rotaria magnacalcarata TaxID=392030 RepID=A0A819VCJ9_9BILA|nr:unnamed protein product [Rotaria magnacalcarata]CAF2146328.1 unnamed protein product [Rotaria magnacalcarata]CAF4106702.1 unnamed protein product [Rotaria magnacalcarata]CAF4144210.1 unnamed protein product [Rotaria magnacalcarata]
MSAWDEKKNSLALYDSLENEDENKIKIKIFQGCDRDVQKRKVLLCVLRYLGLAVISLVLHSVQGYVFALSGETLTKRLRSKAFRAVLRQDIAFFDQEEHSTGALCTRLATEVSAVQGARGVLFGLIVKHISGMVVGILLGFHDYGKAIDAAKNIFQLLNRKPAIDNESKTGDEIIGFNGQIDFDHVYFNYSNRPESTVLKNFELHMKTVGIVSQQSALFDMSIRENIAYGDNSRKDISLNEIIQVTKDANIHDFIELLPHGDETMCGAHGTQLSDGQKQRIASARALIRNPKILLLDEATSALDSENEKIVQDALNRAQQNRFSLL